MGTCISCDDDVKASEIDNHGYPPHPHQKHEEGQQQQHHRSSVLQEHHATTTTASSVSCLEQDITLSVVPSDWSDNDQDDHQHRHHHRARRPVQPGTVVHRCSDALPPFKEQQQQVPMNPLVPPAGSR